MYFIHLPCLCSQILSQWTKGSIVLCFFSIVFYINCIVINISLCIFSLFGFNAMPMNYPYIYIYIHTHKGHKTLLTKVCLAKAMAFPVVMYGCESWTVKKAECWRIDAFELWFWRRLLRVLWTAKSNQSVLKEISPEYSLERLMMKLKLQYFGHLMRRTDSQKRPWCWERLTMGGEGDHRGWNGWMASLTRWTWV